MNPSTALQKHNPSSEVTRVEQASDVIYTPRVDILETSEELTLFVDMPGVRPEDVDVRFDNSELTLHGKCAARYPTAGWLGGEYGVGDFHRAFTIDDSVDASQITAELKNGVLTVHLPKAEAVKPRRITVKGE